MRYKISEMVLLNDAVPLSGLTLNVTVSPDAAFPLSLTSAVNVTESPGWRAPELLMYRTIVCDGGDELSTVAVPLTDWLPTDVVIVAVIVYEPEALFPSVSAACARPLLSVSVLEGPTDALPSPDVILNLTAFPDTGLPSS